MTASNPWAVGDYPAGGETLSRDHTWRLRAEKLRYVPLLIRTQEIGYLGWLESANLGDTAVLEGYRQAFSQRKLTPLPRHRFLERLVRAKRGRLVETVMLGGGTLIGTSEFRRALTLLCDSGARPFMLGPGVEDPDFPSRKSQELKEEQAHWPEVLSRFDHVTVRGPRSQEILSSLGVKADIVGDPALLLGETTPTAADPERRIGVNLGIASAVWGDNPEEILKIAVATMEILLGQGWHVTLVPVWPSDLPYLIEAQRRLQGRVELLANFLDLEHMLRTLSRFRLFIGMKLHSVVLASAVFVPSLMLEYMPKCRDFQASVGQTHRTLRTDRLSVDAIMHQLNDLDENRLSERDHLEVEVTRLRVRLRAEAARIEQEISRRSGLA
jgi:hypothetical protein